jgi:predicted type IV restriction endonuclease
MESLIDRIRAGLDGGLYPNERAVSTSIVVPILRALDWDDSDPGQVMPEYTNPRGRVDYALSPGRNSPAVFVEVKRVGQTAEADRQLFEYAFHEGAQIAVLTDGRIWNFYLPGQHGSYEDRRVYQLDIVERDTPEIVLRFRRYLNRARVADGRALNDAQSDYHASTSRRLAELTLPKAWGQLLAEPDGLLIELLRERTEALCGHKPSEAALEAFLQDQQATRSETAPAPRLPRARVSNPVGMPTSGASEADLPRNVISNASKAGRNSWRVGSQNGVERNGVDTMVALLSAMFRLYPDRQETMAAAVRTRGRNNIARSVADIYPR